MCRTHFIITCYERLQSCLDRLGAQPVLGTIVDPVRQFLIECCEQAANLALGIEDLSSMERAQILDILLWATDTARRLPQKPAEGGSDPSVGLP